MAISPTVNAYMQGGDQQPAQGLDQLFSQTFTNQAYNTLRAKYPGLMCMVTTLKVLASDVDDGSAFGVFALRNGANLVYIPVAMANGSITSCEMVYNKEEDLFSSLTPSVVNNLQSADKYTDPIPLNNNPHVEDTRALFKNMVRPPSSSNILLAASREGISSLPDACKDALRSYLQNESPETLGKIAEFYDVRYLSTQLRKAQKPIQKVAASDEVLPEFLRLDTLTQKMASQLSDKAKKELLKTGYLVKKSAEVAHVAPMENILQTVEGALKLETFPFIGDVTQCKDKAKLCVADRHHNVKHYPIYEAHVVSAEPEGLNLVPVILGGGYVFSKDATVLLKKEDSILVSGRKEITSPDKFKVIKSIVPIANIKNLFDQNTSSYLDFIFFVPSRSGKWLLVDSAGCFELFGGSKDNLKISEVDGKKHIYFEGSYTLELYVTDGIHSGYVMSGKTLMLPTETFVSPKSEFMGSLLNCVRSFDDLRKMLNVFGSKLVKQEDGVSISITDMREEKTASFKSKEDAAEWLHKKYAMSAKQIKTVFNNPSVYVFDKIAFGEMPEGQMPEPGVPIPQGDMEMPADEAAQYLNQQNINDLAEVGDPELLDPGILSSFASYPDIKSLLVDYIPDFMSSSDRLGRVILLFSYQKKQMEDYFGVEKYSTLMASCRRIFSVLTDLVVDLKNYINLT